MNLRDLVVRMVGIGGLLAVAVPVLAQGGVTVVANDNLSLRAASTSDSERLTTIPYLAELPVMAISPDRAWLVVTYNGQNGWVALRYVGVLSGSLRDLPVSGETFLRSGGAVASNVMVSPMVNLNFRTEPTFDAAPAGAISYRESLPALALSADGRFVLVHYHGHNVWVYRPYLEEEFGSLNDLMPGATPADVALPAGADADVQRSLAGICAGVGVPAAAPYDGGPGIHPTLLVNEVGRPHPWGDQMGGWSPASPGQTQLVLCVSEQYRDAIQRCRYEGPDIYRIQYWVQARLVVAQTGQVLAEARIDGTPPRECQQRERWSLTRLEGAEVSLDQLRAWIQPYVAP